MTFSIIAKKECDLRIAIAEILHPDPDRLIFHKLCMDWDGNWRIYMYIYMPGNIFAWWKLSHIYIYMPGNIFGWWKLARIYICVKIFSCSTIVVFESWRWRAISTFLPPLSRFFRQSGPLDKKRADVTDFCKELNLLLVRGCGCQKKVTRFCWLFFHLC